MPDATPTAAGSGGAGEVVLVPVIAALVIAAVVIVLLVVRGSGKANEVAEQQEAELLREMHDAEAYRRLTQ